MNYEVEITNKKTNEVVIVETNTFKKEYSKGRLGNKKEKALLSIGLPNGARFKWFDKYEYSVIVREMKTGRRIETLL